MCEKRREKERRVKDLVLTLKVLVFPEKSDLSLFSSLQNLVKVTTRIRNEETNP